VFEERLLPQWLLSSVINKGRFYPELELQAVKLWTWVQMKQEVFSSDNVSSLDR